MKELGIKPDAVERQLEATAGFGAMYSTTSESQENARISWLLAATNYRAAGSHALLLSDAQEATRHFQQASELYIRAGKPYGAFLGNLGFEAPQTSFERFDKPDDVFALWSFQSLSEDFWFDQQESTTELAAYSAKRVGVLGIEVGLLLDLRWTASRGLHEAPMDSVAVPLNVLLAYYAEALNRARANMYHWRRLQMTFHPLEPDVLGVLVGLERMLASADRSLSDIISSLVQRGETMRLLRGALVQLEAWSSE